MIGYVSTTKPMEVILVCLQCVANQMHCPFHVYSIHSWHTDINNNLLIIPSLPTTEVTTTSVY